MEEINKQAQQLYTDYKSAVDKLKISQIIDEIQSLDNQIASDDFWSDNRKAQDVMKKHAALKAQSDPWVEVGKEIDDLKDMIALEDSSLTSDLARQLKNLENRFDSLKYDLRFIGKYDDHNAVVTLSAGAGRRE